MRNWHPFLRDTLADICDAGHRRTLALILSSLQTEASWDRYLDDVAARARRSAPARPRSSSPSRGPTIPSSSRRWSTAPPTRSLACPARGEARRHLVFTAHSVPTAMAEGAPYAAQLTAAGKRIARRLGQSHWSIAYQSRSGSPRDPWLEPDIADVLRALARGGRDGRGRRPRRLRRRPRRGALRPRRRGARSSPPISASTSTAPRRQRPPPLHRPAPRPREVHRPHAQPRPADAPSPHEGRRHRSRDRGAGGRSSRGRVAARARAPARPHPARGRRSTGRHHPDGAPRRLSRRMRSRFLPLGEAVGARAVPPTRRRESARANGRSLPAHLRRVRRPPAPAARRISAPGADPIPPVRRLDVFSPGRASSGWRLDLFLPRGHDPDESLGAFVRRRLGREALERVAQPLVAGIYTADPDDLSLRATMPRFLELERRERSLILAMWRAARRAPGPRPGRAARVGRSS